MNKTIKKKFNFTFILVAICAINQVNAHASGQITVQIKDELNLRSAPNFSSRSYIKDVLESPQEATVLQVKKMRKGVGLKVLVNDGTRSKIGWVYASNSESKRLLNIYKDDEKLSLGSNSKFNKSIKGLAKNISLQNKMIAKADISKAIDDESIDSIWKNIYDGNYVIDIENDDGSENFPVLKKIRGSDGIVRTERIYIRRNYDRLLSIPEEIRLGVSYDNACREKSFLADDLYDSAPISTEGDTTPGCELLSSVASKWELPDLTKCLTNLRNRVNPYSTVSETRANRKGVYQNMFTLSEREQDFLGAITTGCGEVSKSTPEEVFLVFKSLENRKNIARTQRKPEKKSYYKKRGRKRSKVVKWTRDACKQATLLDVAVQNKQYSMWNKNASHWARCLKGEGHGYKDMFTKMISVYKGLKTGSYSTKNNIDDMTHYHTRTIKPYWNSSPARDSIPNIKVNGKNLGAKGRSHHYFIDIDKAGYSFRYHPYREKKESGEKFCY
jgi:hypothetical protein